MLRSALPDNEEDQLAALYALRILDTEREEAYDRLVRLAAHGLSAPFAVMTLIDRKRQFIKAVHGGDAVEVDRDTAFCSHTILEDKPLLVPDTTKDARFADNPFGKGAPGVRFCAAVPIATLDGHRIGAVCFYDAKPRLMAPLEVSQLQDIALTVQELVRSHEARRKIFRQFIRMYHDTLKVS